MNATGWIRDISIHSPLTRGDAVAPNGSFHTLAFQSTPLSRGETRLAIDQIPLQGISIHSPLTRGDDTVIPEILILLYFNPLPSHEGRPNKRLHRQGQEEFQSTPLSRGETTIFYPLRIQQYISIHSPLTRGDPARTQCRQHPLHFNPLPSHEGRLIR